MSRLALIVGASRGLGLGLCRELASRGWQVVATARTRNASPELNRLAADYPKVTLEAVDLDQPESLTQLHTRLAGHRFDVVLVNAGIYGPQHQSVDLASADDMAMLIMTNAVMPLRFARLFLPQMREHTGVIAFMSSRMGSVADNTSGGGELYRASKAALNSLIRSFSATAIGDRGLTVLALHPGWVRTDMGGTAAPLDVATSVAGVADVLENSAGTRRHTFLDYRGEILPW